MIPNKCNSILDFSLHREALRRYEELAEIFSDKDNYSQTRELLKEVSCAADKERNE